MGFGVRGVWVVHSEGWGYDGVFLRGFATVLAGTIRFGMHRPLMG